LNFSPLNFHQITSPDALDWAIEIQGGDSGCVISLNQSDEQASTIFSTLHSIQGEILGIASDEGIRIHFSDTITHVCE